MAKDREVQSIGVWHIATGDVDLAKIDLITLKQRPPDFMIQPKSFLSTGIKADLVEDLTNTVWLNSHERGIPVSVYVDGSGLFQIANISIHTRFIYLRALRPKDLLRYDYSRAFIIMSMTGGNKALDDIRDAIERGVKTAVSDLHFPEIHCIRVDDHRGTTYKIDEAIIKHIEESGIIICDLTEEKPNCYFELGWALALKRKILVTAKKDTKIHFDVSRFAIQFWESNRELEQKVRENVMAILNVKEAR